jgi:hypothetical protein
MLPITILTGPAASGKNSIGHEYAIRFCERCSVIDVDVVRGMLRQPHHAPWDGEEGLLQHQLGVKHAAMLAKSFIHEKYEVILLDVVWANLGELYRQALSDNQVRIVRLLPDWNTCLERLHKRAPTITDEEARWVYDTQVLLKDFDTSIDNSAMSPNEVSERLYQLNHGL